MKIELSREEKQLFEVVSNTANELGYPVLAIGGFVRDKILGRPTKDIDFVCEGSGIQLAKNLANKLPGNPNVNYFKNFGTAMIKYEDGLELEFVGARKESYQRDSRKPIVENGTLVDDQNRRDFTINAMGLDLSVHNFGALVDPFDGVGDLDRRLIRTPLEPGQTFSDDPLRMLRAIRFATQLDFEILPETFDAIKKYKDRLSIISYERIHTELNKIIESDTPSKGFKLLFDSGLLKLFFPEMVALHGVEYEDGRGHKDNFYHTLEVLDNVAENSKDLWLRWAAILHDIAKPPTKRWSKEHGWTFHGHEVVGARWVPRIFKRLKLPLDAKMKFVQKLVRLHLRPIALTNEEITDSAVRRLIFDAGDDLEALMILCRADITSKNPKKVSRYLSNYDKLVIKIEEVEAKDHIRNWQPPIDGELIMKTFDIRPSREVGIIKDAIKDAILDGDISNDYDAAFAFMMEKAKELGMTNDE